MPLTNSQYDSIMRIYDRIKAANARLKEERYNEVITLLPEFDSIKKQMARVSLNAVTARAQGIESNYTLELKELEIQKKNMLASIGKPADYLDDIYTCPLCRDTGYIGQSKCQCFTRKAIDLVYKDSNLKNITANENFDTFSYEWYDKNIVDPANGLTPYQNMQKVVKICHEFIDTFDNSYYNLFLYGGTGVGKTFLSNCIAKELLDSSHSVIYLTATELFQKFQDRDFNRDYYNSTYFNDNYFLDCDLLIIDDLGSEVTNSYTNSKLFYIINERILRRKSVIISTNLSLANTRDIYSERFFSRITSSYTILKIYGNDIRMIKRTKKS